MITITIGLSGDGTPASLRDRLQDSGLMLEWGQALSGWHRVFIPITIYLEGKVGPETGVEFLSSK